VTVAAESLGSPEGGGDWQDQFLAPIDGQITAVQAGAGIYAGMNCYAWTEQFLDPTQVPPVYKGTDSPRSGTFTLAPAREKNNKLLTPPFFARLWPKTWSNGAVLYEFDAGQVGGGGTLQWTKIQLGFADLGNFASFLATVYFPVSAQTWIHAVLLNVVQPFNGAGAVKMYMGYSAGTPVYSDYFNGIDATVYSFNTYGPLPVGVSLNPTQPNNLTPRDGIRLNIAVGVGHTLNQLTSGSVIAAVLHSEPEA